MKAKKLSIEEITNCDGKEYNPQIWQSNIDRMLKFTNVTFYVVYRGDGYDYDRYFVEYTLDSGLILFKDFGYSSCMSSGGFYRVDKNQTTKDGKTYADVITLSEEGKGNEIPQLIKDLEESKYCDISFGKFHDETNNKMVLIGTHKEARDWMIERSVKYGVVFSKG